MDINSLYKAMPRSLQNLALTFYGFKQHRIRFGQKLPPPYDRGDLHGALAQDGIGAYNEVRKWQELRFAELISHAAKYVPHYRDLFKARDITPTQINLTNFRELLPVLTKQEIVAAPQRFHSEFFQRGALSLFTSGTSGSPMPIQCTLEARAINYAFYR